MSLFSRLFKKQKLLEEADLSVLKADMHSHLIPGIDDGSPSMKDSLALLDAFRHHGYQKVITTPHIMSDFYRNTSDVIRKGADEVREAAQKIGLSLEIEAAAEYYIDEYFEQLIAKKDILTFGDNYVLIEMGFVSPPPMLGKVTFDLQMAGYKPILAHPERYLYWHKNWDKYEGMMDRDVDLQVNLNSLSGAYGPEVSKVAERMIDEGMVSWLGTDCHHMGHMEMLHQSRRHPAVHKALESGKLKNSGL